MKRIIQYFNEVRINELFQVSENLYKDSSQFAEYITELKKTLDKLGVEPESPGSKRNKLINTRYFCSGSDESNKDFWARVRRYIETVYETESIKKIYINSDGGKWIKE